MKFVGHFILAAWLFWALYVFTMGIYRVKMKGKLKGLNLVLAFPIVLVAVLIDALFNIIVATVMFVELPREWLVTERLQRYMAGDDSWRKKIATYICDHVLDVFDPDENHC